MTPRRRLEESNIASAPDRLDDEQRKQRIKAFLGGIYPLLDSNNLPKYLRDSLPREKLSIMDVWELDSDVAFFWHIPKVRILFHLLFYAMLYCKMSQQYP